MEASQLIQWHIEDVNQKAQALDAMFGSATQHVRDLLSQAESVCERPTTLEELQDLVSKLEWAYRGERDRMHREILARAKLTSIENLRNSFR